MISSSSSSSFLRLAWLFVDLLCGMGTRGREKGTVDKIINYSYECGLKTRLLHSKELQKLSLDTAELKE
jgi:hypothetical protein